ncbi:MAG TPA: PP2C family serine/threonine-protein phosphatase [Acidimicrobiia bacterium]|nr:PP2C family serine/threonine-protein phosphatase [Acidimicrobiia bacterium]
MRFTYASATHRGRVRNNNEDAHWPETAGQGPGPFVLMVADGMGGAVAGEVASQLAVAEAQAADGLPSERLAKANAVVFERSLAEPELAGMGTTLTLVELRPEGVAHLAHVGDSRAYLWHDGEFEQITDDHTVVAEQLAAGRITEGDIPNHPQRSMLTRVLGISSAIEVDTLDLQLDPGDRLLICSDGLTNMIEDQAVASLLGVGAPEEVAWNLIEAANRAGGHDNITVIVVVVEE